VSPLFASNSERDLFYKRANKFRACENNFLLKVYQTPRMNFRRGVIFFIVWTEEFVCEIFLPPAIININSKITQKVCGVVKLFCRRRFHFHFPHSIAFLAHDISIFKFNFSQQFQKLTVFYLSLPPTIAISHANVMWVIDAFNNVIF
jgi:hypothetical protein